MVETLLKIFERFIETQVFDLIQMGTPGKTLGREKMIPIQEKAFSKAIWSAT